MVVLERLVHYIQKPCYVHSIRRYRYTRSRHCITWRRGWRKKKRVSRRKIQIIFWQIKWTMWHTSYGQSVTQLRRLQFHQGRIQSKSNCHFRERQTLILLWSTVCEWVYTVCWIEYAQSVRKRGTRWGFVKSRFDVTIEWALDGPMDNVLHEEVKYYRS